MIELLVGLLIGFWAKDVWVKVNTLYQDHKYQSEKAKAGVVTPTVRTNEQPKVDDSETGGVRPPNPSFVAAQNVVDNEERIHGL